MEKTAKHFVYFEISDEQYNRVTELIETLRTTDKPRKYEKQVAEAVLELVAVGFHFFFIDTLKALDANFVIQNTAKVGMKTLTRSMGIAIKQVVRSMNDEQLIKAADIMEQMMGEREES